MDIWINGSIILSGAKEAGKPCWRFVGLVGGVIGCGVVCGIITGGG